MKDAGFTGYDARVEGETMSRQFTLPVTIMGFLAPSIAGAHTGHGHGGGDLSLVHYLNDTSHMAVGLSLAVALLTAIAWARRTLSGSRRTLHGKSC